MPPVSAPDERFHGGKNQLNKCSQVALGGEETRQNAKTVGHRHPCVIGPWDVVPHRSLTCTEDPSDRGTFACFVFVFCKGHFLTCLFSNKAFSISPFLVACSLYILEDHSALSDDAHGLWALLIHPSAVFPRAKPLARS